MFKSFAFTPWPRFRRMEKMRCCLSEAEEKDDDARTGTNVHTGLEVGRKCRNYRAIYTETKFEKLTTLLRRRHSALRNKCVNHGVDQVLAFYLVTARILFLLSQRIRTSSPHTYFQKHQPCHSFLSFFFLLLMNGSHFHFYRTTTPHIVKRCINPLYADGSGEQG